MSENATEKATATPKVDAPKAEAVKEVTPKDAEAIKAAAEAKRKAEFDGLSDSFKDAIKEVNKNIATHNGKVDSLKSAASKDPKAIKADIFEQSDNKIITRMRTEYDKLMEQAEKLRMAAYTEIDKHGLMPKDLSEAEVTSLKSEVTESTKTIRSQVDALETFEKMFKIPLTTYVDEIKTQRGISKSGGNSSQEGVKRPRFKKIEINGLTQDANGKTVGKTVDGETKYTLTFAAQYLAKQHKGITWTSGDLQEAYYQGLDQDNLPEIHTFVMPYTYKDANGNEQTVNYTIKTYR